MKNYKILLAAGIIAGSLFSSCIKHEVIPAPEPKVDLYAHFAGDINGTPVEFTENVLGYANHTSKAKILLPSPSLSSAVYYSEMKSAETLVSIKVGLGSVMWDASTTSDPTLSLFNSFHLNNTTPVYSNNATSGFEVTYRDAANKIWTSKENSVNPQSVTFSALLQESDASGDYSKFTCNFSCYVYRTDPVTLLEDSVRIQSAVFKGWFQR